MSTTTYTFQEFGLSSELTRHLISKSNQIKPLVNQFFSEAEIIKLAEERTFSKEQRLQLSNQLIKQNADISLSEKTKRNIDLLKSDNTYTITTGHQLNMATGPLYTLYKILEVINWTEQVNENQDKIQLVPVFWMATEDHDFEEINHINLYGSKIEWLHEGESNSVVGRLETDSTTAFIDTILSKFGNEELNQKVSNFLSVYKQGGSLAMANRSMINELFNGYGLVIIDGDDSVLKQSFTPVLKAEISSTVTSLAVEKANAYLAEHNYHQQVYVRPCNLFFIAQNGARIRIEKEGKDFKIGTKVYSREDLIKMAEEGPENFSPNALLRPVYQEVVLPNLVYVGGGGEIAYWLQLKSVFEAVKIDFPLLKVRDSVLLIDPKLDQVLNTFNYSLIDLKMETTDLLKDYVVKNSTEELSLENEKSELTQLKLKISKKALAVDQNAERFVEGEFQRILNQFDKMEKKFIQAEKKNNEKQLKQLTNLKQRIYPNNSFQERVENYVNYIQYPNFIENIKSELKQRMTENSAIHVIKI